eukprot:CAMPEP_0194778200 /NCGR_PEP_ID=MMETSP0323_2-20130528/67581_1 /TAXON_ID=2866 ORGANISM="Crypthecodinium cohnii, Strain Seligo" /NCGR_SAMPLE_ID=MMETSP0323_2 /ASSEMBLY_ACC=CAM_ASM_000346 /LENGTH=97 /DNA_ID=CAMNT_0039715277 /DNA_START=240 /DNA_END=529 /DNA_ORIENTATION=-
MARRKLEGEKPPTASREDQSAAAPSAEAGSARSSKRIPSSSSNWSMGSYHSLLKGRCTPAWNLEASSNTSRAAMAAVTPTVRAMAVAPFGSAYSMRV